MKPFGFSFSKKNTEINLSEEKNQNRLEMICQKKGEK